MDKMGVTVFLCGVTGMTQWNTVFVKAHWAEDCHKTVGVKPQYVWQSKEYQGWGVNTSLDYFTCKIICKRYIFYKCKVSTTLPNQPVRLKIG